VRAGHRGVPVGSVRDAELADPRLAPAAGGVEHLAQLGPWLDGDHQVGVLTGQGGRLLPGHGDADPYGLIGQVPQLGRVHVEVRAAVVDVAAGEQGADDLDGLGELLVPDVRRLPALADDVLVEVLAGTEAEGEATLGQERHGGGLLGDDRRVVAHGRVGHVRHERDALGRLGGGAEDAPGVRRVALGVEPGVVVVGDHSEVEAGLLGPDHVPHQLPGSRLLTHHRVTDPHETGSAPSGPAQSGRRGSDGSGVRGRRRRRRV
jgi:hypothetical protein